MELGHFARLKPCFKEEFARRRTPSTKKNRFNGNPYKKFKRNKSIVLTQGKMTVQKFSQKKKKKTKKRIVEKPSNATNPSIDMSNIFFGFLRLFNNDLRGLDHFIPKQYITHVLPKFLGMLKDLEQSFKDSLNNLTAGAQETIHQSTVLLYDFIAIDLNF